MYAVNAAVRGLCSGYPFMLSIYSLNQLQNQTLADSKKL